MARRYAPVLCSIWDDPDFQALTPGAQRLYVLLLSQKRMSLVGVVPHSPRNWSRGSEHTTLADIESALAELVAGRYVLVDADTDELLVRTMVKHDPPKGAKSRAALWRALALVDSETLRQVIVEQIDHETWADPDATPPEWAKHLRNAPSDAPSHPPSDAPSDGARRLEDGYPASSLRPPATGHQPPATVLQPPRTTSSSSLTPSPAEPVDDDEFVRTIEAIVEAKYRARADSIREPRPWRAKTRSNVITEHGDTIRQYLADGHQPNAIAKALAAGKTLTPPGPPPCTPDCETCEGTQWARQPDGRYAPCPQRTS